MMTQPPTKDQIIEAHDLIRPLIHRTPVLTSDYFDKLFGCRLYFKCENFQKAGAFKSRGATFNVMLLTEDDCKRGVATHSSGNHAQALARAASLRKVAAYVVMPSNSSKIKIDAVKQYGGQITFCEPTLEARETTLEKLMKETGALEIHPYNDYRTITGQATAAKELIEDVPGLDLILAPVGGGGLLSGTALAASYFSKNTRVMAAEPSQADDASRSFKSRTFVPSINPSTVADGLRTSLGDLTLPIILEHITDIVTVEEHTIIYGMKMIWERMKIIIETSSSVPLAALLEEKINVAGKKVGIILSGGNVDLENLPW